MTTPENGPRDAQPPVLAPVQLPVAPPAFIPGRQHYP